MRLLRSPIPLVAAALTSIAACEPDPITETETLPYEGEAYPDRVAPVAYPPGPVGFVTDSLSDTVSVIDLSSGALIDRRPVGRNPVDLDGPHHIAIDQDLTYGYVALSYPLTTATGPHALHGSAVVPGYIQKLRLSDLSVVGQVRVEASPGDIALSADGKRIVVTHFDLVRATKNPTDLAKARATIAVASPDEIEPIGSPSPHLLSTCVAPHGMAMTQPTGSPLYVTCYGEDKIAVVDLDTDAIEYVDVGPGVVGFGSPTYGPYAALLLEGETTLVVSSTVSKDVRFIDTTTLTVDTARTVTTLGAPYFPAVSTDGTKLVIPTQQPDALVVVDLTGVEETETRTFLDDECVLPHAVQRLDSGYAVVCEGDKKSPGRVVIVGDDLETVSTTEVGVYPDSIVRATGVMP
ncbi:MAG: YncE family protein [Polyangiaceae bacterium]|nr:YncE family protein [Polyangiaceae bacterium]